MGARSEVKGELGHTMWGLQGLVSVVATLHFTPSGIEKSKESSEQGSELT